MTLFIKKNWTYITYVVIGICFLLMGILGNFEDIGIFFILNKPFEWLGFLIRKSYSLGGFMIFMSYFIYILIGLTPLIYPIICSIKQKKIRIRYISFIACSIFLFILLYFFINPQNIELYLDNISTNIPQSMIDGIASYKGSFISIVQSGMVATLIGFVVLAVLLEISASIELKKDRVYFFAKACIFVFIICILFSGLFAMVYSTRSELAEIEVSDVFAVDGVMVDEWVNCFVIVIELIFSLIPLFVEIGLLLLTRKFIIAIQNDFFQVENKTIIQRLVKYSKFALLIIILCSIINNVIYLIYQSKLTNTYYELDLPYALIFVICLVFIFSKIYEKAIEVNEENKLVI